MTTDISQSGAVEIIADDSVEIIQVGTQGPPGLRGNSVLNDTTNPLPAQGIPGDFYLNTATMTMFGPKVGSSWGAGTLIVGPPGPQGVPGPQGNQGPPGPAGNTILNGIGPPVDYMGRDGDFYVDTSANYMYGPKASGHWPTPGYYIVGPPPWSAPTTWAASTAYMAGPPASTVTSAGSAYVCIVSHTSSSNFNNDLTAGKWTLLAQGSSGGITDAPSDSTTYGRRNAIWVNVVNRAGDTMTGLLVLSGDPTAPPGAVTRQYADTKLSDAPSDGSDYGRKNGAWDKVVPLAGGTMTGALILAADPAAALGAATKQYADLRVLRSGDTMTGALILNADPSAALGAATKQYADGKGRRPVTP